MAIILTADLNRKGDKKWYTFEWGKGQGQRRASGIFTYTKPKDQIQKQHNAEAKRLLDVKLSEITLDHQSVGSSFTPSQRIKENFLDFYADYVKRNRTAGNRHLNNSFTPFKGFLNKEFISAKDITEELCLSFRSYLLKNFNGETPGNYFAKVKKVMRAARKARYFQENPSDEIAAKTKRNRKVKEILEPIEYLTLLKTPCLNDQVRRAFIFCMYSGLRWCDVKPLIWENMRETYFQVIQVKTEVTVQVPLHPVSLMVAGDRLRNGEKKTGKVFQLPSHDGANKILGAWCRAAGLEKHITWHCARHSFSVLLQDEGVRTATVAGLLGTGAVA